MKNQTRIDLRSPAARKKAGLNVDGRSRDGHVTMSGNYVPRKSWQERKKTILEFISENGKSTRLQLAEAIGLRKTPYFIERLEDMVKKGDLIRETKNHTNGVPMYVYGLPEMAVDEFAGLFEFINSMN